MENINLTRDAEKDGGRESVSGREENKGGEVGGRVWEGKGKTHN